MIWWKPQVAGREMIYRSIWDDFIVRTDYHRVFDLYVTTVKMKGDEKSIESYCTDSPRYMDIQHNKGLKVVLTILGLAMGGDDF